MTTEQLNARYEKQRELCERDNLPLFAPKRCFNCHEHVFKKADGEKFITSCPNCYQSFCD